MTAVPLAVAVVLATVLVLATHEGGSAQPGVSKCSARAWGSPISPMVERGDTVKVRMMIGWSCPERTQYYDLALVADYDAFAGESGESARNDTKSLVRRLDLAANDQVRLGIVGYGDDVKRLTSLKDSTEGDHLDAIHDLVDPPGGTPVGVGGLADAVHEGLKMLDMDPRSSSGVTQDPALRGMVVLASPRGDAYCDGLGVMLQRAAKDGVKVTVMCMDGECDSSCFDGFDVRKLSRYAWDIMALEQERLAWQSRLRVEMLDVREFISDALTVVEETVRARGGSYNDELHLVRWKPDVRHDEDGRMLVEYEVRGMVPGEWPVRKKESFARLRDTKGRTALIALPLSNIVVTDGPVHHGYLPRLSKVMPGPTPTPQDKTLEPVLP